MDGISCIWHAFDALDERKTGRVNTTTLRVLTHNIGTILGLQDVEKSLPEGNSELSFEDYIAYFKENVPAVRLDPSGVKTIADVTWLLCEKSLTRRAIAVLGPTEVHKLWQVFHVICQSDGEGQSYQPVVVDVDEAAFFVKQIRDRMNDRLGLFDSGNDGQRSGSPVGLLSGGQPTAMDFKEFLHYIEASCTSDAEREVAVAVVDEMYQYYVLQKLKKGELSKSGDHIRSWRKRWFVLTTSTLNYYADSTETDLKGSIPLQDIVKVEIPASEKTGPSKFITLLINCGSRTYELHCPDLKTRHSWLQALLDAMDNVMSIMPLPKKMILQRQKVRCERRARDLEERQRLLAEKELDKQERLDLEARLRHEAELRQADEQRLRELEELRQLLERLLAEERQAKRDEEIVRALQARMIDEEMQKREHLERLREEQEELLQQERQLREQLLVDQQRLAAAIEEERQRRQDVEQQKQLKEEEGRAWQEQLEREKVEYERLAEVSRQRHNELERLRQQQDEQLAAERAKLLKIEDERRMADEQLQTAMLKLQESERAKQLVQERARLRELQTVGLRRPIQPSPHPLLTHRGVGAFTADEFDILKEKRLKEKRFQGIVDDSKGESQTGKDADDVHTPSACHDAAAELSRGPAASVLQNGYVNRTAADNPVTGHY